MDWRVEDVYKLISLYKKSDCLWDRNNANYKKFSLKCKAWDKIAKEMNKSVDEVKRKVKNLRSCYLLEAKKVADSIKFSSSPGDIYTPHLFYYEKMRFLDDIVFLRNSRYQFTMQQESLLPTTKIEFKQIELNESPSNNIDEFSPEEENNGISEKDSNQENVSERSFLYEDSSLGSHTNSNQIKRPKNEKENNSNIGINRNVHCGHNAIFSSFAKSIELQLSHLPIALAAKAMAEMQQILANCMVQIDYNEYENSNKRK